MKEKLKQSELETVPELQEGLFSPGTPPRRLGDG